MPAADPRLTSAAAAALLATARDLLLAEIADADPARAVGLALAARELTGALPGRAAP